MKGFVCVDCSYRWYEPEDNKRKSGWGCPNGCTSHGIEIKGTKSEFLIDTFERLIDKEKDENEKSKFRYHLSLLKGTKGYM